jgi:aldose 1-epimerase
MVTRTNCQYILSQGPVRVGILNLGAAITFVEMPDRWGRVKNIVAGFAGPDQYARNEYYFGCIVGRYANRIGGGRFPLDGRIVQLSVNNGGNHLHGGFEGLHRKRWKLHSRIEQGDATGVVLECTSPAAEEGYPGNCRIQVTYLLDTAARLSIHYSVTTDAATPVNLTNHSYFNLSGFDNPVIDDHLLRVHAGRYTEKNGSNLPTGRLLPVQDTPMDLTTSGRIGDRLDQLPADKGYDHNFVLDQSDAALVSLAAELDDPGSGRRLRVFTDQPGIQVYTANWWDGHIIGSQGVPYVQHGAVALETQAFPDSPNQPSFPNTILRPGEIYQTTTIFEFKTT